MYVSSALSPWRLTGASHVSATNHFKNGVNNWPRCTRTNTTLISCGDPSPALTRTHSTDVIYSQHVAAGWVTTPPRCYRWPGRGRSRWCRWAPGCMESQRNRHSEAARENKASSASSPARGLAPPPSPGRTEAGTAEVIHHGWSMNALRSLGKCNYPLSTTHGWEPRAHRTCLHCAQSKSQKWKLSHHHLLPPCWWKSGEVCNTVLLWSSRNVLWRQQHFTWLSIIMEGGDDGWVFFNYWMN